MDWAKLCHALERFVDESLYNRIILQFSKCNRRNRKGEYCNPYWCQHIKIRVLGLHTYDAPRPLDENPHLNDECESCHAPNRECDCEENWELYTCDYCGQDTLIEDTISTDKDRHACQNCFVLRGLFLWTCRTTTGCRWLNPVSHRWTRYPMVTLNTLRQEADIWQDSDLSAIYWKRYANALAHSVEFLQNLV